MKPAPSILIVEDEAIWAKQLEINLRNLGFDHAATYTNATEAMVSMDSLDFDIALLDIRMNGINAGIALGKMVHGIYKKPFIFITSGSDKEMMDEAITAQPSAYLLKPVSEASLYVAIQTALDNFSHQKTAVFSETLTSNTETFFAKIGNHYKKVEWKNVVALSVDGRYTKVILNSADESYLIGNSLTKTMSTILPTALKAFFVQVNRNDVVNVQYIQELRAEEIRTKHHVFFASANYLQGLKERLTIIP
jgi:DNA-binding LytR/AlgR family response regulator